VTVLHPTEHEQGYSSPSCRPQGKCANFVTFMNR